MAFFSNRTILSKLAFVENLGYFVATELVQKYTMFDAYGVICYIYD